MLSVLQKAHILKEKVQEVPQWEKVVVQRVSVCHQRAREWNIAVLT